ncbi:macrolide efflux protein [Fictibacillus macauensis ZFHKF-1]|uniref:Macrolide efflux protein n=1 Tax=Fictibacillus macauensis ZFHKF-1 TaxID=1196324 RepID=I8UH09_9BACL|nr:MFS transporter [Fictibacillus macauensis]EIT86093.1 macrolide efflux protein [Fictibacillus macauensis ZFHKF-1]
MIVNSNRSKIKLLIFSDSLSKLGNMAEGIALATFVYTLTQSSLLFGLFLFFRFVPELIVGPYSGYLADKYSRKTITTTVNIVLAVLSLLLIVFIEHYTMILIITTIASFVKTVFKPSFMSSIPFFVSESELPSVNRWFGVFSGVSRVVGSSIAAFVIVSNFIEFIFILNALTYFIFAVVCWISIPTNKRDSSMNSELEKEHLGTYKDALNYLWESKKILGLVIGSTILWGCLALSDTLLVPTLGAARVGGEDVYGFYRIISAIGMIIGSYLSYKWYRLFQSHGKHLIGFYIPIIVMCLFTLLIPFSPFFLGYLFYLIIWIAMDLPSNLLNVELQTVPNKIRGKIIALADAVDGILFSLITLLLPLLTEIYEPGIILKISPIPFIIIIGILLISSLVKNKGRK